MVEHMLRVGPGSHSLPLKKKLQSCVREGKEVDEPLKRRNEDRCSRSLLV